MNAKSLLSLLEQITAEEAYQLLDYGTKTNQVDMIRQALASGQVGEHKYATYLKKAMVQGSLDVVKFFLDEVGIDVNSNDFGADSPLHTAARHDFPELAKILIEHGADVNIGDGTDYTPLHICAYKGSENTAKVLIDHGADINAENSNSMTPLHLAADYAKLGMAKLLLDKGADPNPQDYAARTPLYLAQYNSYYDIAELIRSYGGTT